MYASASFLLTLLLVYFAKAAFEDDCSALNVGPIKSLYVFGSCFVIDTTKSSTASLAAAQCTHMTHPGHLGVAPVRTIIDILSDFLTSVGVADSCMALHQYDNLDEPLGHWEWVLDGGSALSDLVHWIWPEPNNAGGIFEDCGVLSATARGYYDAPCTTYSKPFLCQYVNPIRERCYTQYQKHRFNSSTQISDDGFLGAGLAAIEKCAKKCGRHPLCFGYKMKRSDGHCWIHQDDGQWPGMEPIEDSDYDLYVMKPD